MWYALHCWKALLLRNTATADLIVIMAEPRLTFIKTSSHFNKNLWLLFLNKRKFSGALNVGMNQNKGFYKSQQKQNYQIIACCPWAGTLLSFVHRNIKKNLLWGTSQTDRYETYLVLQAKWPAHFNAISQQDDGASGRDNVPNVPILSAIADGCSLKKALEWQDSMFKCLHRFKQQLVPMITWQ